MRGTRVVAFQELFRSWFGSDPDVIVRVAEQSGYSAKYVRWTAGLTGKHQWPGSRKFIKAMAKLGCSNKPWRDRSPEEIRRAFQHREVLYDPASDHSQLMSSKLSLSQ